MQCAIGHGGSSVAAFLKGLSIDFQPIGVGLSDVSIVSLSVKSSG